MATITKKSASPPAAAKRKVNPVSRVPALLRQWRTIRSEVEVGEGRQDELKTRLMSILAEFGEEDDKGNLFIDFTEPVEVTDIGNKVFRYLGIKRERRLTPAAPLADQKKALELLRAKRLWMSASQERSLRELQLACRFASIRVEVDVEAVAKALFEGLISDKEYQSVLQEQREVFAFKPLEEK